VIEEVQRFPHDGTGEQDQAVVFAHDDVVGHALDLGLAHGDQTVVGSVEPRKQAQGPAPCDHAGLEVDRSERGVDPVWVGDELPAGRPHQRAIDAPVAQTSGEDAALVRWP